MNIDSNFLSSKIPQDLKNKTVLITGTSSGIGKALLQESLSRGAIVIGISRSLQKQNNKKFIPIQLDITKNNLVQKTFINLKKQNLIPQYFFLNAGIAGNNAIEYDGFEIKKHKVIMEVNYFSILNVVHHWCMNDKYSAHFIITNSVNSIWAPPNGAAYAASKAAIAKVFESLSLTITESKFSSIYCGPVKTNGLKIKGKLPFIWSAEKIACYMLDFAVGKRSSQYPSIFYYLLCKILSVLPYTWVRKIS